MKTRLTPGFQEVQDMTSVAEYFGLEDATVDAPFWDATNPRYQTWGDYLLDERVNGLLLSCRGCGGIVFIWLDCRRGDDDRYCVTCGHAHKQAVVDALHRDQLVVF